MVVMLIIELFTFSPRTTYGKRRAFLNIFKIMARIFKKIMRRLF